ncbi:MAG: hypothetical protein PW790_06120 [Parvibaculaceae bacterium]|nr:hypothetical protein [Parvibaculaceae bacterium]
MTAKKTDLEDEGLAEIEALKAEIENLKSALEDKIATVKDSLSGDAETVREKVEDEWDDLKTRIADNPVPSALVALGIGFIIGRFIAK